MTPVDPRRIVFWDVDTQVDFMTPAEEGGELFVKDSSDPTDPGATQIRPALARLPGCAREAVRRAVLRPGGRCTSWHAGCSV